MDGPIQLLISLPFRLAIGVFSSPVVLIAFVGLLFDMRWSTDGPGLLLVFVGLGGFGLLAIVTWVMWVMARRSARAPAK